MKILFDTKLSENLELTYYKINYFKKVIYYIVSILSLGFFNYYFSEYKYKFYEKTKLESCTYIKIKNNKRNEIRFNKLNKKKIRLIPYKEKSYLIYFKYKYRLYYYSKNQNSFILIRNKIIKNINLHPDSIKNFENGLNKNQVKELLYSYGRNIIEVPKLNFFHLFLNEVLSPITFYQIICAILWIFCDFAIYAYILLVLIFIPIFSYVYQMCSINKKTREMAFDEERIIVKRNNEFVEISSLDLTIGDIIKISPYSIIPCDILLIKGKCIVKEAMLTGEIEPIIKLSFKKKLQVQKHNLLLAGTNCLISNNEDSEAIGIVVNTGFYTYKGELIRSLLLGKSEEFQYNKEVVYVLLFTMVFTFVGFFFYIFYEFKYGVLGLSTKVVVLRAIEFFATSIPPTLPICLTIGLEFAVIKLKKYGIQTQIMAKINEAGRIKIMCFDKTGTLTENELIFKGFMPVYKENFDSFQSEIKEIEIFNKENIKIIEIMGCCHSLDYLDGELIGDPLEIEMFKNSSFAMFDSKKGTNYFKPKNDLQNLLKEKDLRFDLIRKIDFTHERKRFSCIVKDVKLNKYFLFSKGSPDTIRNLSIKNTIPEDFNEKLILYSQEGFRILGFAFKEIKEEDLNLEDFEIEKNLIFNGLIFFENPLKKVTKKIISELKFAGIKNIMITGDSLLTSLNVALNCKIVDKKSIIWLGELKNDKIEWKKLINEIDRKNRLKSQDTIDVNISYEENPMEIVEMNKDFNEMFRHCKNRKARIILSGNAFEKLYENRTTFDFDFLMKNSLVFGRTNPQQKALIVKSYKDMLEKKSDQYFVGFCGDGANDCPALKKANVGISLSELEASIAAPFTSTITDISNVPNLIKEGKASLITGFQNFKLILNYSLLIFVAMMLNFVFGIDFSSGQYYLADFAIFFPINILMNLTDSSDKLVKKYPPLNIFNSKIMISIVGSNIILILGLLAMNLYIEKKDNFLPITYVGVDFENNSEDDYFFTINYFNFIFLQITNIFLGVVLNQGDEFKKKWYTNKLFVIHFLLSLLFLAFVIFVQSSHSFYIVYFFNNFIRKLDYDYKDITFLISLILFVNLLLIFFESNINFFVVKIKYYFKNSKKT